VLSRLSEKFAEDAERRSVASYADAEFDRM